MTPLETITKEYRDIGTSLLEYCEKHGLYPEEMKEIRANLTLT